MNGEFADVLRKIAERYGKEVFLEHARCKALLEDYAAGEFQKEMRLFIQALEAGFVKALIDSGELPITKKQIAQRMQEDLLIAEKPAAEMVNAIARALRGGDRGKVGIRDAERPRIGEKRSARKNAADKAEAFYERGIDYYYKGDFDSAITEFTQALRIEPDHAVVFYNRGVVYGKKGDFDRAIADYSEALRIEPDYADALNNRGAAYENKGDFERAIADYDEALRIEPDDARALQNREKAYKKMAHRKE
jgi:tetratricopeptide (TPR) repeat protein